MEHTSMFGDESIQQDTPTLLDTYFDLFVEMSTAMQNAVSLKGNILLNKLLPNRARSTADLDMSILNKDLYPIAVDIMTRVAEDAVISGKCDRYTINPSVEVGHSGGITAYLGDSTAFKVDISIDPNIYIRSVKYTFDNIEVLGSSFEAILCDKILATLSQKRFRRAKDFFDLYILKSADIEVNYDKVVDLMMNKVGATEVKNLLSNYPFDDNILAQLSHAWERLKLASAVSDNPIHKPPFLKVYGIVSEYYYAVSVEFDKRA